MEVKSAIRLAQFASLATGIRISSAFAGMGHGPRAIEARTFEGPAPGIRRLDLKLRSKIDRT
jgi:hypothetical protein